jgi:hypothetical protein
MIRLAFRNLFQSKIRLVISVGGVALALLLILSLDAIFNGVEQRITVYINNSGADVFVPNRRATCYGFLVVTCVCQKDDKSHPRRCLVTPICTCPI